MVHFLARIWCLGGTFGFLDERNRNKTEIEHKNMLRRNNFMKYKENLNLSHINKPRLEVSQSKIYTYEYYIKSLQFMILKTASAFRKRARI